jgi:hypothetical protein
MQEPMTALRESAVQKKVVAMIEALVVVFKGIVTLVESPKDE